MKATKVVCPRCGAEFLLPQKQHTATVNVIGKDSQLGTIYLTLDNGDGKKSKAQERIEKMREAGIDTSKFFAMNDVNGDETQVGTIVGGSIRILPEDDIVVRSIMGGGTLLSSHLFKQHVLARMLKMLTSYNYMEGSLNRTPGGQYNLSFFTNSLRRMGYDYQWRMLRDELYRQYKMFEHGDSKCFAEDNRWYNRKLVLKMIDDYIAQLSDIIGTLKYKRHNGRRYVMLKENRVKLFNKTSRRHMFYMDEIDSIFTAINDIKSRIMGLSTTPRELYNAVKDFYDKYIPLNVIPSHHCKRATLHRVHQCREWVDAYKGYGAFFSMQNLILFHGCTFEGKDKDQSIGWLNTISVNQGYWLLGALREMLRFNNFDIEKKQHDWRQAKRERYGRR